jgi:hypothetical protein
MWNKTRPLTVLFSGAALLALASCGGGGGGADNAAATSASATALGSQQAATASAAAAAAPMLGNCEMFPAAAIFNTRIDDVSRFPAHPNSAAWIAGVGNAVPFHADWGMSDDASRPADYFGLPVNTVDAGSTQWPTVSYDFSTSGVSTEVGWPHEGDCAVPSGDGFAIQRGCANVPSNSRRFPFPSGKVLNQGGNCNDPNSCGDHHVLVVEQGACRLWEGYAAYNLSGQWYALATAAWDLKSLALRPNGWTAATAAGLPITPLLARAAEASTGEIRHALGVAFHDGAIARDYVWPARHAAGGDNPGAIPFGALLRLKADFVIPDNWTPQAKAIATAAKRYGMYVTDNGADFHIGGEPSAQWDYATFGQLNGAITMSNMEFVNLNAVTTDPRFSNDSMAASW